MSSPSITSTLDDSVLLSDYGIHSSGAGERYREKKLREQVLAIMDGKTVQITMNVLTIFALYGDDMRVRFAYKAQDPVRGSRREGFLWSSSSQMCLFS